MNTNDWGPARTGLAALCAVALFLTGCGGDGGDGAEGSAAPMPVAKHAGESAQPTDAAAIGDEVVADGITVTVDEVTFRGDFRTGADGDGATEDAADGKTFVFVHTTVENTGDDDIAPVCGDVIATLTDDDGTHGAVGRQSDYVANPPCDEEIAPGDDGPAIFLFEVGEDSELSEFHFRLRDHADDRANTVVIDDLGAEPADRAAHPSRATATRATTTRTADRTTQRPAAPRTSSVAPAPSAPGDPGPECVDGEETYLRGTRLVCIGGEWVAFPEPPPPEGPPPPPEQPEPEQGGSGDSGGAGEGG